MNPNLILIIILIVVTIIFLKCLIKRLLGYKGDDEYEAEKENVLNSNDSYTNYSVTIKSETAHDIYFLIKLMRPIMMASILLNILCIPTLLFISGFVKPIDSDTFITILFGMFFVIGALAVALGYIREKMGVRFMVSTFIFLSVLCVISSVLFLLNFQ